MISVIIPTMWLSDALPVMVERYLASDLVSEVLVIDNNPEKKIPLPGSKIIYSGKNIYVNPAWEMGVKKSQGEYILLANDDIRIDNLNEVLTNLVNNLGRNQIAGLSDLPCTLPVGVTHKRKKKYYTDWGSFIFLRKSDYLPIPHSYKIMCGDWWLWQSLQVVLIEGVKGKNEKSVTVNANTFTDVINQDKEHFIKTYKPNKKILHIIMSSNHPEYLVLSLNSLSNLWHSYHDVHRVLIDNHPNGRNNELFSQLARTHKIDELILNKETKGLSFIWHELCEKFRGRFDYVLLQEDDVILNHRITINTMIQALYENEGACSVMLARQPRYAEDVPCKAELDDMLLGHHRLAKRAGVFSQMGSFYPAWVMDNEEHIIHHIKNKYQTLLLKNNKGGNMITHIGDTKTGKVYCFPERKITN